ncbi:MAG: hypothetical protein WC404_03440 [Candidatus Omnitrophota bacterium]|jgi:hypothetical protein
MDTKALSGLVSRLKAIIAEIEAVIGSEPQEMSRDEYLNSSEDERMKHDKKKLKIDEEEEE